MRSRLGGFDFGGTLAYRLLGMLASFGVGALIVSILTQQFGVASYAAFALVASFLNLLPFADLGLGASVVNAAADTRAGVLSPLKASLHIGRARDLLLLVAVAIGGVAIWVGSTDGWVELFGGLDSVQLNGPATATFICVALSIPLGMGARLLQAAGMTRRTMQLALMGPSIQAAGVAIATSFSLAPAFYMYLPGVAYLTVNAATFVAGLRAYGHQLPVPFTSIRRSQHDGIRLSTSAAPFLIISVSLAVGFQSHRTILALFGTPAQLAEYSLVAQFTGPLLALLTVSAQNLWPRYRTLLAEGLLTVHTFISNVSLFAFVGAVGAAGLAVGLLVINPWLTGGRVALSAVTLVAAGVYVVVTATHQPGAMLLNDVSGLWLQAGLVAAASAAALPLMIAFIPLLGAASPYACFAGAMALIQVLPTLLISKTRILRSRG